MIFEGGPEIGQSCALVGTAALEFGAAGAAGVDVDAGELARGVVGSQVVSWIEALVIETHNRAHILEILF